jgi:transposase
MGKWAKTPMDRNQVLLFHPTLDDTISENHPVRLYDEILRSRDWSAWESQYVLTAGQPPIHPRIMASVLLYGLSRGIRSSRMLEYMCCNSMDYLWLTQGHQPDHSTLCKFRLRFEKELKGLFRQITQVAIDMELACLVTVALDGSRVRANSSRHSTAGEKTITETLQAIDAQIEKLFTEMSRNDRQDQTLFGSASSCTLPAELADLQTRQERLRQALEAVQKKTGQADSKSNQTPRVPIADPDATILPNKEGGYAPNYTVFATTESKGGFIMDAEVVIGGDESEQTLATVDRIEENFEETPENMTADTAFVSSKNLAGLKERGVVAYMPQCNRPDQTNNSANRENPTEPVPAEAWDQLPRDSLSKKLHRSAFVFDAKTNCYYCPMGRTLVHLGKNTKPRKHGQAVYQTYRCQDCSGCALSASCRNGTKLPRTLCREQYEELREAMDARMATPAGRQLSRQRNWIAETPFAILKAIMNLRQFLTRGIDKVKTEWLWACTSFNLTKLVRRLVDLRAESGPPAG